MISAVLLLASAVVLSLVLTYPLLWLIRFFHFNQAIREEGPQSHQCKTGTPTMGGIGFILAALILSLIFINYDLDVKYLGLIFVTLGFAAIGLTDDILKVSRQRNLGLTFWQKIVLQIAVSSLFAMMLIAAGHQNTVGNLLGKIGFSLPIFYFLFSIFVIVGTANATNLTDGLNGLLAGTGSIAFLSFAVLSGRLAFHDASTFCLIFAGALLAFLYYNFPKARVFMGDVGSLTVGAALAGVAILAHKELRLMFIGGIFMAEALSVILQVGVYKLWKKRIFKMAPLHHHFELMGFKEIQVVLGFWAVGLVLGVLGAMW
jgi:phospho-N-acetylmuramoyl-pentapeptide-transferase